MEENMEEKNKMVLEYINSKRKIFEENGYPISDETVSKVTDQYLNSPQSLEEIKKEIDELVAEKLEQLRKEQEKDIPRSITDFLVEFKGITLNEQDIDLMMIANAETPKKLQEALKKITNINIEISNTQIEEEQFLILRQNAFDLYIMSLTPINEYLQKLYLENKDIRIEKKIEYLQKSGIFDTEELQEFNSILKNGNGDINKILSELNKNETFSKKMHQIFQTMKDYEPIEKDGIIGTEMETFQRMFQEMNSNYNSITIDECAKYGNVALPDGTFDFSHLQKTLEFVKENGKQVRLNTLLFYMDCPDGLYNLPDTEENRQRVKHVLSNYVEQITSFIKNNGYEENIRSIDVFNELLNRFAMGGDIPYQYRGVIFQDPNAKDFDNIKSGWLKFLSIEDLCDVIAIARGNLPNTDFMYNDDNLVDPSKMDATIELIDKIRQYEIDHRMRLIDSIGTQMHIDNNVSKEAIVTMFDNLAAKFGLPIEVTEFDLAMTSVEGLSENEIQNLRIQKMNEFYESISECKDRDKIRGLTIWSKTDAQNFRVALENEQRIKNGQEPIKTLHGGFYNDDMSMKKPQFVQGFNYHTHTYRSGHSEYCTDREIVEYAKKSGITSLGFSEHIPNTDLEFPDEDHRMMLSEVDEYVASIEEMKIEEMKNENPDMTIRSGFEAEFDPMKEAFLGEMREKVDYMILGQHFVKKGMKVVSPENNPYYPEVYADMVCQGIDSGLFDIVAHPDCFMEFRNTIKSKKDRDLFDEKAKEASLMICEKAAEMGIPIEINLGDAFSKKKDDEIVCPDKLFWEIASRVKNLKVLQGIDAHCLLAIEKAHQSSQRVSGIIEMVKDKMVGKGYDPVIARQNNKKLQDAYEEHQAKALTYETHMINGASADGTPLDDIRKKCENNADEKIQRIEEEIQRIEKENSTIKESLDQSSNKPNQKARKEIAKAETKRVLANQERVFMSQSNSTKSGTLKESKKQPTLVRHFAQRTEDEKKIYGYIKQKNKNIKNIKENNNNNKVKKLPPKGGSPKGGSNDGSKGNKGFANIITVSLIVGFVCGALFMIIYMLIMG